MLPIINKKNEYNNMVHTPRNHLCARGVIPTIATVNTNAPLTRLFGNELMQPHQKEFRHIGLPDICPIYTDTDMNVITLISMISSARMSGFHLLVRAGDCGL